MRLDENGDFIQSWEENYDPRRSEVLQGQLAPEPNRGTDQPQSDTQPVPEATRPQAAAPSSGSSGNGGGNNGGSSRDQALQQVQQQYQSSLGRAAQGQELQSSIDAFLKYGTNGQYGGELQNIANRANNLPGGVQNNNGIKQYSSSGGEGGGSDAISAFLAYLQQKDAAGSANQAGIKDLLMSLLGQYQQPVSANDPGISSVLAGQRVASQRAAERSKAQAAEKYASQGLGRSGAFDVAQQGIDQQRGEANTKLTGQVMYQELNNRRQALTQLLSLAVQSGDAESARNIQAQLTAIQTQMQQGQFNDTMGFNYNQLNAGQNSGSLAALLGLLG